MGNLSINNGGIVTNKEGMPSIDFRYGPYASLSAAHAALSADGLCAIGLTVGIINGNKVDEYWYQEGIELSNLVKKIEVDSVPTEDSPNAVSSGSVYDALEEKQEKLVSGLNIKTINGQSIVGEGNLVTESDTVPFDGFILLSPITIIDGSAVDPDAILYYRDANRFVAKKGDKYYNNWANRLLYNNGNAPYTSKLYPYDGAVYTWDGTTFAATGGTSVRYDAQTLTAQQKEQAAQNIGLDVVVKGDVQQSFSDAQRVQAQNNMMGKVYDAATFSGLGKKMLAKNMQTVGGVDKNVMTQAFFEDEQGNALTNTVFVIQYDYTLGENITIPENCVLQFDGGSISGAHALIGQNTVINSTMAPIFDGIVIQGTWNNNASYLSWFVDSDDYSEQIVYLSLLSKKVYLNKSGNLKGRSNITKEVEIDGCNNTFYVYINDTTTQTSAYSTLSIDCHANVNVHNVNFIYSQVITNAQGRIYNCLYIRNELHIYNQFVNIHDVTIRNFDNRNTNPCQFRAIMVQNFDEGNSCDIHDIIIENCINLGDGVPITGTGEVSGIRVQVSSVAEATGVGNIYNITINKLANCNPNDHEDLSIIEDCNGIYICAVTGVHGMETQININLHDFYFTDVSERCFKLQGKNVSIKNIYNKFTTKTVDETEVPIVRQSCIVNMQGDNLFVENIYGEISNNIVQCTGGKCVIKNSILEKSYNYGDLLVDSKNAILENCEISIPYTLRSIFYGYETDHDYTIKNCKITLSGGCVFACSASISNYISVNIQIENTHIEGLTNVIEWSEKVITKLTLKDTFFGTSDFGYMVQNCDFTDSKITCMFNFVKTFDDSEQTIKIKNSEFVYTLNADGVYKFPIKSKVNLENVIFTNNASHDFRKLTLKIVNGTNEAILNNIRYNKIYGGKEQMYYEVSKGGGNVKFKKNGNIPIGSFTVKDEETPVNPLTISYNSIFNPDISAIPYIDTSIRILNVPDLNFVGKDGVTYCYNNKNVYYRNSQWVDATGTPV